MAAGVVMDIVDRWLLPDGVDEILPEQARRIEQLRRRLLDLYDSWGYELVIPPLMEFSESLLIGMGSDMELQTFKMVDQLSGRTLAIRADITPQTARMDAHSLRREGPTRLCYSGTVLHTLPKTLMASRAPIEVGAELYGDSSIASDGEVILLMLETLKHAGAERIHLDLGHVRIYRELIQLAGLGAAEENRLFDALQRKAVAEVDELLAQTVEDAKVADMLRQLTRLNGDESVIDQSRRVLAAAPVGVANAIDELAQVAEHISRRQPEIELYFDLSELRGYHYHTGLVFAALTPGFGQAVANGGRYDNVGKVFGRGRPATGFSADLKALSGLMRASAGSERDSIFAALKDEAGFWEKVQALRAQGERVVCGLGEQESGTGCDRVLIKENDQWLVKPATSQL